MNPQTPYDLTRITLAVLIIGVLIAGSLWTLLPFVGALIWEATIVVATWPLLVRVQRIAGEGHILGPSAEAAMLRTVEAFLEKNLAR